MTLKREKTAAEKTLLKQFEETFRSIKQHGNLNATREQAFNILDNYGLPSRRIENWHYTDLPTLLKAIPPLQIKNVNSKPALCEDSFVFSSHYGTVLPFQKNEKFKIKALKDDIETLPMKNRILSNDDAIGFINTALATDGWDIEIPENVHIEPVIELQSIQSGGQSHLLNKIKVCANARCTFAFRQSNDDEANFLTALFDIEICENAHVTFIIIREDGVKSIDFNRLTANLKEKSNFVLYLLNAGTHLARQEINVTLEGEEADFQLRGINLLSNQSHTDTTMVVRHICENTTSTEIMRNVVMDKARGIFQGMIRVAQAAQKTDARMACNSLILSDDASFDAKPELEIFADDVACGHGATVAEINQDHLYYLMARGIPEAQARGLLIKAFVSELIDEVEDQSIQQALSDIIDNWLEKHL